MSEQALSPAEDIVTIDLDGGDDEVLRRFRAGVRREIATQLSSGHPIFYCGLGEDAGKLFMRLPDGRRYEYRVAADGTREIVRDVSQ